MFKPYFCYIDSNLIFYFIFHSTGDKAAIFSGHKLHHIIAFQDAFAQRDFPTALKDGFLSADRSLLLYPPFRNDMSGCTATTAIIADGKIIAANSGDSRTVLGVKGTAKPMSFDHKPQNEGERNRIIAAGGFVESDRVNGNLALSRALGDFDFKKSATVPPEEQIVTALPDIIVHEISPDDEFLVLACDGIWDFMDSQAVVEFVRRGIAARQELQYICENIMNNCLAPSSDMSGVGCDNMTIMIVGILNGKTKEEWYDLICDRVAKGDGPVAPESAALAVELETDAPAAAEEETPYDEIFRRTVGGGLSLQQLLGSGAEFVTNSDGTIVLQSSAAGVFDTLQRLSGQGDGPIIDIEDDDQSEHAEHAKVKQDEVDEKPITDTSSRIEELKEEKPTTSGIKVEKKA